MFADEVPSPVCINFKHTLTDLSTRVEQTFAGCKEIEILLKEQTKNLKKMLSSQKREISTIFELSGTPNYHKQGFDCKGDNDILKINFGGRNVEIKRSCLTKPAIGWNLFSCLFQKRWDRYHVRDRTGRIYVDLKEEWMRPLIDYMKYSKTTNNPIQSVDVFLRVTMAAFRLDEKLLLGKLVPSVSWVGLESSALFAEINTINHFRRDIVGFFPCIPTYFKRIYSSSKSTTKPFSLLTDVRFKPIFCLWKPADGRLYVLILSWTQRPSANIVQSLGVEMSSSMRFDINECGKQVNVVSDLFPIQFTFDGVDYSINNPPQKNEVLELYEVHSSMYCEATPVSPLTIIEPKKEVLSETPSPFMQKIEEYSSHLKKTGDEIIEIKTQLELESYLLFGEVNFISGYFYSNWKVTTKADVDNHSRLKEVISCRDVLNERHTDIKQKKRKLSNVLDESSSHNSLDPIVYFNVEGEIFTILRSTILRVIPNSQLAVRVSGRWEEQPSKGDIDEEGNLIVNCHKESFKQILSALQIRSFGNSHLVVFVNPLCKDYIEETLDYLQIVPDLIITIENPI
jgi:hypothetical protein